MNPVIQKVRLPLITGLACILLARPLPGQDGSLVDRRPVDLAADQIAQLESIWPASANALARVELRAMTYWSDGLKINGYWAEPKRKGSYPCVIFNRGGNREFGALNDLRATVILGRIASWGYVVVASQYRGNGGSEGREEFGGRDLNDVLHLIPLLESLPKADAKRIGMYGWSRGAMMTYQALAKTDRLSAAIVGAGPTDLVELIKDRPEMETHVLAQLVPDYADRRSEALRSRSVVRWAEQMNRRTPLLILHGSADMRVNPRQPLRLMPMLWERNHPVRFVCFEGGDHSLRAHRSEVNRLVQNWLARYVRDGDGVPRGP